MAYGQGSGSHTSTRHSNSRVIVVTEKVVWTNSIEVCVARLDEIVELPRA